jgi:hypothetical protein
MLPCAIEFLLLVVWELILFSFSDSPFSFFVTSARGAVSLCQVFGEKPEKLWVFRVKTLTTHIIP